MANVAESIVTALENSELAKTVGKLYDVVNSFTGAYDKGEDPVKDSWRVTTNGPVEVQMKGDVSVINGTGGSFKTDTTIEGTVPISGSIDTTVSGSVDATVGFTTAVDLLLTTFVADVTAIAASVATVAAEMTIVSTDTTAIAASQAVIATDATAMAAAQATIAVATTGGTAAAVATTTAINDLSNNLVNASSAAIGSQHLDLNNINGTCQSIASAITGVGANVTQGFEDYTTYHKTDRVVGLVSYQPPGQTDMVPIVDAQGLDLLRATIAVHECAPVVPVMQMMPIGGAFVSETDGLQHQLVSAEAYTNDSRYGQGTITLN